MQYIIKQLIGADLDPLDPRRPRVTPGLAKVYLMSYNGNKAMAATRAGVTIYVLNRAMGGKSNSNIAEAKLLAACQQRLDTETFQQYALPKVKEKPEKAGYLYIQHGRMLLSKRLVRVADGNAAILEIANMVEKAEQDTELAKILEMV